MELTILTYKFYLSLWLKNKYSQGTFPMPFESLIYLEFHKDEVYKLRLLSI